MQTLLDAPPGRRRPSQRAVPFTVLVMAVLLLVSTPAAVTVGASYRPPLLLHVDRPDQDNRTATFVGGGVLWTLAGTAVVGLVLVALRRRSGGDDDRLAQALPRVRPRGRQPARQ